MSIKCILLFTYYKSGKSMNKVVRQENNLFKESLSCGYR